jgi:general stress protein YciG
LDVREAGRRGGKACAARRGRAHYQAIGKKGGAAVVAKRGKEFFATIGKMGGDAAKAKIGSAGYAAMGRLGGARVREVMARAAKWEDCPDCHSTGVVTWKGGGSRCVKCGGTGLMRKESP